MKYHTILFDLDGTLLNTLEDLTDAVNYVMDAYDFPEHSIEDVRCFVGNGIRVLMQRAIPEGEENPQFDEAFELFKRYYLAHNKVKTRPYDGIMELLGELKKRGVHMAIVSNKNQPTVEALCEEEFQGLISVAVGDGEGRARKPAPDGPMEAIRSLGLSGTELSDQTGDGALFRLSFYRPARGAAGVRVRRKLNLRKIGKILFPPLDRGKKRD